MYIAFCSFYLLKNGVMRIQRWHFYAQLFDHINCTSNAAESSSNADLEIYVFLCRLFQVTWLTKTGFIYDRYNLSKVGTLPLLLSKLFSYHLTWYYSCDYYFKLLSPLHISEISS